MTEGRWPNEVAELLGAISFRDGKPVPIVFSLEQAKEAMTVDYFEMMLCVAVPRASYCKSVAEAAEFFKK
jgi:hypothetical protein